MKTIDQLKKEAKEACIFRGHKLARWSMYGGYRKDLYSTHCKKCGKSVYVEKDPLPNGIEIGGSAVTMHCE